MQDFPQIARKTRRRVSRLADLEMAIREQAFGQYLARLRKARGLNQTEAAYEIGISARQYQNWEGGTIPQPRNQRRLAEYYGIKLAELQKYVPKPEASVPAVTATQLSRIERKLDALLSLLGDEAATKLRAAGRVPAPGTPRDTTGSRG